MICSAIVSLTCSATGIGWYGDPVQHGWETPRVHSLTFSDSALSDRCSSGASRASTALPSSLVVCESCIMFTETVIEVWLVTSACPGVVGDHAAHRGHHDRPGLVHLRRATCTAWCRAPAGTTAGRRGRRAWPGRSRTGRAAACASGGSPAHPHEPQQPLPALAPRVAAAPQPRARRRRRVPVAPAARLPGKCRAGTSAPRPATPDPMTVRGRPALPSQPLRGRVPRPRTATARPSLSRAASRGTASGGPAAFPRRPARTDRTAPTGRRGPRPVTGRDAR